MDHHSPIMIIRAGYNLCNGQTDIVKSNACYMSGDGIREVRSGGVIVYLTGKGWCPREVWVHDFLAPTSLKGASSAQLVLGW